MINATSKLLEIEGKKKRKRFKTKGIKLKKKQHFVQKKIVPQYTNTVYTSAI